jgi:hypothetical protein
MSWKPPLSAVALLPPRHSRPSYGAAEQRDKLAALQLIKMHSGPPAINGQITLQAIELAGFSQPRMAAQQGFCNQ